MDAQDYPIRHFEQMTRLAIRLKAVPAQVLEHTYSYDSFGSWTITLRCMGRALRFTFDGRHRECVLERTGNRQPPYAWSPVWRRASSPDEDLSGQDVVEAIERAATGP
jgi:hypothetical protein